MENLALNFICSLLFVLFASKQSQQRYNMLSIDAFCRKKFLLFYFLLFFILYSTPAHAEDTELFKDLIQAGSTIFVGVRNIVYVVAGFGIIGVAIGGFFGNLNWKWLGAIIIGLMVIALTTEILRFVSEDDSFSIEANAKSL